MKGTAFNLSWPQVIGQVASAIAEKEDMVGKLNDGNVSDSQLLYRFKRKGHAMSVLVFNCLMPMIGLGTKGCLLPLLGT